MIGVGVWSPTTSLATAEDLTALQTHGDTVWSTATGFTTISDLTPLAKATDLAAAKTVIDAIDTNAARLTATRAVYIDALATPANFKADLTGIAKTTDIPTTTINNSKTILDKFDSMIEEDT